MAESAANRRLAAVLSADVVGYSRLVTADDVGALRRVSARLADIGGIVRAYGGRVVDARGDNLLASFATATQEESVRVGRRSRVTAPSYHTLHKWVNQLTGRY